MLAKLENLTAVEILKYILVAEYRLISTVIIN